MLRKILNCLGYVRLETAENWVSIKNKKIASQREEIESLSNRTNRAQHTAARYQNDNVLLRNRIEVLEQARKTRVVKNGRKEH